ncbi:MAG: hypothetical protein M3Z75_21105 [Actinomycetota bacterium]|nr:hypothetical protein [Actinomycetota bacterium]
MRRAAGTGTNPLGGLEFRWGLACHLAVTGGACTARRKDGKGGTLTDPLPGGSRPGTAADYQAGPGDTAAARNAAIRAGRVRQGTR